jgi:hypothetical protein
MNHILIANGAFSLLCRIASASVILSSYRDDCFTYFAHTNNDGWSLYDRIDGISSTTVLTEDKSPLIPFVSTENNDDLFNLPKPLLSLVVPSSTFLSNSDAAAEPFLLDLSLLSFLDLTTTTTQNIRRLQDVPRSDPRAGSRSVYTSQTSANVTLHRVPLTQQSTEWLQQHAAYCLEEEPNTDEALLTTSVINVGVTIMAAPVLTLSRKMLLLEAPRDSVKWTGYQLLLNYCLGHHDSDMLFLPLGAKFHEILLKENNDLIEPNVGLRWNSASANRLLDANNASLEPLVVELYALRTLQPNEEWVFATHTSLWSQHARAWNNNAYSNYQSAADWEYQLLTINIQTLPPANVQAHVRASGEPCEIVAIANNGTVRIRTRDGTATIQSRVELLRFTDKPYTANHYLRHAFRQERQFPEEMARLLKAVANNNNDDKCGLYMAPSGIPNAGLGIFCGHRAMPAESVVGGSTDVVIQIDDFLEHNQLRTWFDGFLEIQLQDAPLGTMSDYLWNGDETLGHLDAVDIMSSVPGPGMLGNSHPGLVNAVKMHPTVLSLDLHRSKDPGAGASSTWHGAQFLCWRDIVPGEEVFVDYGENWFTSREELGPIPLKNDYVVADSTIARFLRSRDNVGEDLLSEHAQSAWEKEIAAVALMPGGDRIAAALPFNVTDIQRAAVNGTARFHTPNSQRPMEWLELNGLCLDNIRSGPSSIPQSGKGAFATRALLQGHVIAPIPLIHTQRRYLTKYSSDDPEDPDVEVREDGHQLLLNYCFGHRYSSLLLFTYAPVVSYINHNSTFFNAELRWSTKSPQNNSWLHRTPNDLFMNELHVGLMMEVIATRNIEPGEEVRSYANRVGYVGSNLFLLADGFRLIPGTDRLWSFVGRKLGRARRLLVACRRERVARSRGKIKLSIRMD